MGYWNVNHFKEELEFSKKHENDAMWKDELEKHLKKTISSTQIVTNMDAQTNGIDKIYTFSDGSKISVEEKLQRITGKFDGSSLFFETKQNGNSGWGKKLIAEANYGPDVIQFGFCDDGPVSIVHTYDAAEFKDIVNFYKSTLCNDKNYRHVTCTNSFGHTIKFEDVNGSLGFRNRMQEDFKKFMERMKLKSL